MWPLKMMMEISYYRHEKTAVVSCSVENKLPNNMHSIIHFFLKEVIYISIYLRIGIGSARRNSAKQWFYLDHKVIDDFVFLYNFVFRFRYRERIRFSPISAICKSWAKPQYLYVDTIRKTREPISSVMKNEYM